MAHYMFGIQTLSGGLQARILKSRGWGRITRLDCTAIGAVQGQVNDRGMSSIGWGTEYTRA